LVVAVLTGGLAAAAPAAAPRCATIKSCGTTITKSGNYCVIDNLYDESDGTSDCISISAAKVALFIDNEGNSACVRTVIQGNGSSKVGIHILPGASNVSIVGEGSIIAGWGIGIEDEGDAAFGQGFYVTNNSSDGLLVSGATGGSFLLFSSGLLVDSSGSACFTSLAGEEQGVRLQNTTQLIFPMPRLRETWGD
jgi:hypothetical protein